MDELNAMRRQADHLMNALSILMFMDPNVRVSTASVFLAIAAEHPKGITSATIGERLQMPQSSVSRAVARLSSRGSESHSVGEPLKLVTIEPDPEEPRRYLLKLTKRGENAAKVISDRACQS